MRPRSTTLPTALVLVLAAFPAAASAHRTDRDHDRMPDRWERAHHLDTHRDDAAKDADHDGLRNLAEFRAHTDPRNADSDDDGVRDGEDIGGTVASFTGGVLTITTPGGGSVAGRVTDATQLECEGAGAGEHAPTARSASDDGDREDSGDDDAADGSDDHGDDDRPASGTDASGTRPQSGDTSSPGPSSSSGPGDGTEDDGHDDGGGAPACTTADLVAGKGVHEATLRATPDGPVWKEIKLVK